VTRELGGTWGIVVPAAVALVAAGREIRRGTFQKTWAEESQSFVVRISCMKASLGVTI
jgi:hypothetical protein